jgi:golgi phosphoprotein 3
MRAADSCPASFAVAHDGVRGYGTAMTELSLAEELLLVALDDEKGADTANWGSGVEAGLAGALLLELTAAGCLAAEDGKLVATDCDPHRDPLAAAALDVIRGDDRPRDAKAWVGRLPKALKPLRERIADRLVERGVLEEERRRRLGLFEFTRYPARDPAPERRLRAALTEVLVTGREPSAHETMLVSLLHANDLVARVVQKDDRRAARRRAKEIAKGEAIGAAVGSALSDVQAATMAAITAATVASSASSGGGDGGGGGSS